VICLVPEKGDTRVFKDGETYKVLDRADDRKSFNWVRSTVRIYENDGWIVKVTGDETPEGLVIWGRKA